MMRQIRTVLADDEPLSMRRLEIALGDFEDIEIVGKATDGLEARELIRCKKPELLFLDIRMPGLTGIELVESFEDNATAAVVFVTAFDNFAVEAFGLAAIDYLLKPLETARLEKAIERARSAVASREPRQRHAELARMVAASKGKQVTAESPFASNLWVALRNRTVRIPTNEVRWFEAAGDYVVVHTPDQDYLMPDSLRALETRLDPRVFLRVHRGRIVNRHHVAEVIKGKFGKALLRLANGDTIPIGRSYRFQLYDIIKET